MLSVLTASGLDYDTILKWEQGLYRKFTPADTDVDDFTLFDANKGHWVHVKSAGAFNLQPRLLSSVRADVDVEPQGNYPSFEDLQISSSLTPLGPTNQTHIVFLPGEDSQQLALANTGGGILAWDVVWTPQDATNANWLQISSTTGITTIENDVIQLFLDRTRLPKGTYRGNLLLRTTAGNRSFQVVANVADLRGEWRGVAQISNVNGKKNEVADIDLHLDFDLDPSWWHLEEVCRQTERRNYQGRVAIGHATKLSALPPDRLKAAAARLAKSGVAVTVLPATDLYLMGRDTTHNAPRGLTVAHKLVENGVVCSVATNNVLNPFTPFGDASLLRMANFYANVAHAGISEFDACLDLVTELPARLMNLRDYGIAPGNPADLVILDTDSGANAIAELPDMLMGFKNGRQVFERRKPTLFPPAA